MIGHKHIIDFRKEGKKPSMICIDAGYKPPPVRFDFEDPERALDWNLYPTVYIEPHEMESKLDFRFVIGCLVQVSSPSWSDALFALIERIAEAKPKRMVICCVNENADILIWERGEYLAYAD